MGRYLFTSLLLITLPAILYAQNDEYNGVANDRQTYTRTAGASELKIRLSDNSPITVMLDRAKFTNADRLVRFANIPPRRYRLKVFVDEAGGMKRRNLVYDGYIRLESSTSYYMVVDRVTGSLQVNTSELEGDYVMQKSQDNYEDYSRDQYEDDVIISDREERNTDGANLAETLTMEEMNRIGSDLGRARNGHNKLEHLQRTLGSKTYTSAQVKTMMSWLDTDQERLSFIKWAYDNTVDIQNYWRMENGFTSQQVKTEFNHFLDGRR